MRIFKHFPFTGRQQKWTVPAGIIGGSATFECWGAAGGMASGLHSAGKVGEVRGGDGPANNYFTNHPSRQGQLGSSFANNAGYAMGVKAVSAGETYYVYVGGNGGPGHSAIKLNRSGSYSIGLRGGAGGWNGGGRGGLGAHVYQNLYNSTRTSVTYKRSTMPGSARVNQLWWDTSVNKVKRCNTTYTAGHAAASKWDTVTYTHTHAVGPSGGGGGGATDIRAGGDDLASRILVAGGSGGAGGGFIRSATSANWDLRQISATPKPPFGTDTLASGATGPDSTWCTAINFIAAGWGIGGIGGATGNAPQTAPTITGGSASSGGAGGPGTARHKDDVAPTTGTGAGGGGGEANRGGSRGAGGRYGSAGSFGVGGVGNTASGGIDDWCAGGGGGGGGFYGGGGGGEGFFVDSDDPGAYGTHAGGGGGGSNYAAPVFSNFFLGGGARPPYSSKGTGANGLGGFARISYRLPPRVRWTSVLASVLGGSTFTTEFSFTPAVTGGAKIDHFVVGTGADTATFPTTQSTIMVSDHSQTDFAHDFVAPAVGSKSAIFVRVVDEDGDASDWLKQVVTGIAAGSASGATITAPASGAQILPGDTTVTWTPGTQTPEVAYRLTLSGEDLATGSTQSVQTGWRRAGSRVNLATDPGFQTNTVWSSDDNTDLVSQTTNPGVSGKSGKIAWALTDDGTAENHTTVWDNLVPDKTYRLHIEVASSLANDTRQHQVQIWGENGLLTSYAFDLSAQAAGAYLPLDIEFTPTGQGIYVVVLPSATSASGDDPVVSLDFEDTTTMGFSTGSADTTHAQSGDYALKATAASVLNLATLLTAGNWVLEISGYAPAAATTNPNVALGGTGVSAIAGAETIRDDWGLIRLPFSWDGVGTATLTVSGETAGHWWDDVTIWAADNTEDPDFGNTDTGQTTYLANLLLEVRYEEDSSGYGTYFDGGHANGNPGTASWSGAANASPSYLTGTDATTGAITYTGPALLDGALTLETLTEETVADGYDGATTSIPVKINPSVPTTPVVGLLIDHGNGRMQLTIDAADTAASVKTVSFDVFRDGQRIATGLVPDATTRVATFYDTPGHAQYVSYLVRAFNSDGGYTDQSDGSVTEAP